MVGAAIGVGTTLFGINQANDAANSAQNSMNQANQIEEQNYQLAQQQYSDYKNNILPLEMEAEKQGISARDLALQRGGTDLKLYQQFYAPLQQHLVTTAEQQVTPQINRVTGQAASDVNRSFENQRGQQMRQMERMGVRPDSGEMAGLQQGSNMAEAAARAQGVNTARENEIQRAQTQGFNQMLEAEGRSPMGASPSQSSPQPGINPNAVFGAGNAAARVAGQQAGIYGNAAAGAYQGAFDLGNEMENLYNKFKTPPAGSAGSADAGIASAAAAGAGYADGGPIPHVGLVDGPGGHDQVPATIDGVRPTRLTAGEYVIPKDVVDYKGRQFFERLVAKHHARGHGSAGLQGR